MHHDEILFKARDYRDGGLSAAEKAAFDRHLASCAECSSLFARWDDAPLPTDFVERVMDGLPNPSLRDGREAWLLRMQWWGAVAALMLVGLVFWRPEREWINADRSFAWMGPTLRATSPVAAEQASNGAYHE